MDGVINGVIAAPGVRGALRSIPPVNVFLEADGARIITAKYAKVAKF